MTLWTDDELNQIRRDETYLIKLGSNYSGETSIEVTRAKLGRAPLERDEARAVLRDALKQLAIPTRLCDRPSPDRLTVCAREHGHCDAAARRPAHPRRPQHRGRRHRDRRERLNQRTCKIHAPLRAPPAPRRRGAFVGLSAKTD